MLVAGDTAVNHTKGAFKLSLSLSLYEPYTNWMRLMGRPLLPLGAASKSSANQAPEKILLIASTVLLTLSDSVFLHLTTVS